MQSPSGRRTLCDKVYIKNNCGRKICMDIWYWIPEYGKVFFGYLFLMFLWPSVVFRNSPDARAFSRIKSEAHLLDILWDFYPGLSEKWYSLLQEKRIIL